MIIYSIRFDDPGLTSRQDLEQQIFDLLRNYGLCATAAVIPFHADEQGLVPLERGAIPGLIEAHSKGVIEIAQHGNSHISRAGNNKLGDDTEFAGLPQAQQLNLISSGKALLEVVFQTKITGFVPPWNSYDQATLEALIQDDFGYISAGWENPIFDSRLVSVPRTCNLWELKGAISKGVNFGACQPHVIAVMHHYDFKEVNPSGRFSLQELEALLAWLCQQPDLTCKPLSVVASEFAAEPEAWLSFHRQRAKLPWFIRKHIPRELLMKASFMKVLQSIEVAPMFWPKQVVS